MVTVYSLPDCSFCKLTKEYLQSRNIAFKNIDISSDKTGAEAALQKSGQMAVPVIDIDGQIVVGFRRSLLDALLPK